MRCKHAITLSILIIIYIAQHMCSWQKFHANSYSIWYHDVYLRKKLIQYRTVEHSTNATKTHHHMPGSCKKCASDEQM